LCYWPEGALVERLIKSFNIQQAIAYVLIKTYIQEFEVQLIN